MGKVEVSSHHSPRTEAPGNVAITSTNCQFLRQWEISPMAFVVPDSEEQGPGVVSPPKSIFRCEYLKENIPLASSSSPRGTPGGGWSFEPSSSTNNVEIRNGKPVCEALERSKAILKAIENRKPSHEAPQKIEVSSEGITRRKLICEALETSKAILEALEKKGNSQVTSPRVSSGSPAEHGNLHVPSRRPVCPYLLRGKDSASLSPSDTSEVQRNNMSLKSPFKLTSDNIALRDETPISMPTTTLEVKRKSGNISLSTGAPPAEGKQGRPIAFPPSSGRNTATPTPHRLRVKRPDGSTTPAVESRDKNLKYLVIGNISRAAYRMGGDVAPARPTEHDQRSLVGSRPSILQTSPHVTRRTREAALTSSTVSVLENQRKRETTFPPPELPEPGLLKKSLDPTSSNGLVCELLGGREKVAGPQEREDLPSGDPPGHTTDGTRDKTVAAECISCTGLRRNSGSSISLVNLRSEPQSPESCNTSGYTNSARQHLKHGRRASNSPPGAGWGSSSHPSLPARPPATNIMTPADRMESKYRVNIGGNSQSGVRTCNDQFTIGSKRTRKPESNQGSDYSAATHTGQYLQIINIDQNIPECKSVTENIKVLETLTEGSNGVLDSSDGDWFKITKDFDHQASFPDHLNCISAKLLRNGTVSPRVLSPGSTAASAHGVPSGHSREKFDIIGGKSEFSKSRTSVGINRGAPSIGTGARPMATYLRKFTESRPSSRQNNEEPMENREKNIINTKKENKKNIEILQSSDRGGEKKVSSPSSGKDKDDATTSLQHKVMTGRVLSAGGCGDHLSLRQPDSSRLPQPVAARMKNQLISTLETSKNFSNNALKVGSFNASPAGSSQQNGTVKREYSRLSHQLVGTREEDGKRSGNTWVPVVDGKRRPSALSSPTGEDSGRNFGDHSILYIPHHILWNTKKDSKTKVIVEEALYTAGTTSECLEGQENNLPGNRSLSRLSCVTPHSDDGEFSGSEALEKYDQNLVLSVSPSDSDTSRQNDLDLVPPSLAPPLSGHNY